MKYEYVIRCLGCGHTLSQGGFDKPVKLSDEEVLAKAGHNPGCFIQQRGLAQITRSDEQEGKDLKIAVHHLGKLVEEEEE